MTNLSQKSIRGVADEIIGAGLTPQKIRHPCILLNGRANDLERLEK